MKKLILLLIPLTILLRQQVWANLYSLGLDKSLFTTDFMIGKVVVSVIFVESDGSFDPNIENWTVDRKNQVLSEIMSGLDWWTQQNPRSPVSFVYDTKTITTRYEPITRPYYDEALWIPNVMGKLGYSGSRFSATRTYVNDLRSTHDADWGFVIFMIDSLADINGKLADGYFAYAYLGGPFMVMTYDNNGYGISNMDVVTAHEVGHIFHALDQYAGASSPDAYSAGYFPTLNGNHVYSPSANDSTSIMRGGIRWGLDSWTRQMVGWRDANNNNRDDLLDQPPNLSLVQQPQSMSSGELDFSGQAKIKVCPRQNNVNGYGFTVDTIARVEYKIGQEEWTLATPSDGQFDQVEESFQIVLPTEENIGSMATISASNIELRVVTAFSSYAGTLDSSGDAGPLAAAHAYPNPFKPNSNQGKTEITFSNVIPGSKIQIFSAAGEPVFEKVADSTTLDWITSSSYSSGVYYFLITDNDGHKKTGKLAIIR